MRRMLISVTEDESFVAVVEDGVLYDLHLERAEMGRLKGNIYKGVVSKVEPALQAAFVDFGVARGGFLALDDVHSRVYRKPVPKGQRPRIQDVLVKGQELMVQVTKEPIGNKGAALTTNISLPGRFLVLMPNNEGGGVSRRIEDEEKRKALKDVLKKIRPPEDHGLIIRTAGMERTKVELERDLAALNRLWDKIKASFRNAPKGVIFREQDVVIRAIRDYYDTDTSEVIIDDEEAFRRVQEYVRATMPRHIKRFKLYKGEAPLFVAEGVEGQIDAIYSSRINLPSGGALVLEPTEALVSIDVNSGKSLGEKGIEETAFKTNLEAASEVARQLRLRDLGGLIVIDFIDMRDDKHNRAVEKEIKAALKSDKAKVRVGRISTFGLMEMSRQRVRPVLMIASQIPCPTCVGKGLVVSPESGARRALRRLRAEAMGRGATSVRLDLPREDATVLLNQRRRAIAELELETGVVIEINPSDLPPGDQGKYRVTRENLPAGQEATPASTQPEPARDIQSQAASAPAERERKGGRRGRSRGGKGGDKTAEMRPEKADEGGGGERSGDNTRRPSSTGGGGASSKPGDVSPAAERKSADGPPSAQGGGEAELNGGGEGDDKGGSAATGRPRRRRRRRRKPSQSGERASTGDPNESSGGSGGNGGGDGGRGAPSNPGGEGGRGAPSNPGGEGGRGASSNSGGEGGRGASSNSGGEGGRRALETGAAERSQR